MNWVAAVLPFPAASMNVPWATSIVVAPLALGVKVAVYTVELVAAKLESVPPETVISPTAKVDVISEVVNVRTIELSLVVAPSLTALLPSLAVITIVGATLS